LPGPISSVTSSAKPVAFTHSAMSAPMPGQLLTSFSVSPGAMLPSSFFASTIGPGQTTPVRSSTALGIGWCERPRWM
jgi:hypothetical protein